MSASSHLGHVAYTLLGGLLGLLFNQIDRRTIESYDIFNQYITFPKDFTNAIDQLLMNPKHGWITSRIHISSTIHLPGEGRHYLYRDLYHKPHSFWDGFQQACQYVVFDKTKEIVDHRIIYSYRAIIRCWSRWMGTPHPQSYLQQEEMENIPTIHLDLSGYEPNLVSKTKTYAPPYPSQERISLHIIQAFEQSKFQNVKYLLSGAKGRGKSFTASVLKKKLEQHSPGVNVLLFDDLNPSAKGLDIETLILSRASAITPLILVIDEYDVVLDEVIRYKKDAMDMRFCHTESKLTFNAMLDAIGRTRHVIVIFTSEKPIGYFKQDAQREGFVRKGRLDWYVEVNENDEVFQST